MVSAIRVCEDAIPEVAYISRGSRAYIRLVDKCDAHLAWRRDNSLHPAEGCSSPSPSYEAKLAYIPNHIHRFNIAVEVLDMVCQVGDMAQATHVRYRPSSSANSLSTVLST